MASTEDWSGERGFLDDDARDLSPKTAKRLEQAIDEIELETSMWDASVYLGTPIAGSGGSALFALLLLFNIVLQFSFIAVIAGWYGPVWKFISSGPRHRRGEPNSLVDFHKGMARA